MQTARYFELPSRLLGLALALFCASGPVAAADRSGPALLVVLELPGPAEPDQDLWLARLVESIEAAPAGGAPAPHVAEALALEAPALGVGAASDLSREMRQRALRNGQEHVVLARLSRPHKTRI